MTAHTKETATPSAETWRKQVTTFWVPPKDNNEDVDLDTQTQRAAAELKSAVYDGKTVVIVWEHKRIANKDLRDTFWTLLKLGEIDAPQSWKGVNYDFFWIIDYTASKPKFTVLQQQYAGSAGTKIPDNLWGEEVDRAKFADFHADCKHKEE